MRPYPCEENKSHKGELKQRRWVTTGVVSSAAVIWVVTQRFSPTEALRDDPNNGCGGDFHR